MKFDPPLLAGTLVRRYKRFLADIITSEGQELTIHCPNTGSMRGCCAPGSRVWYWDSGNPKRKYPHTWELVEVAPGSLVGINTLRANQLVKEALLAKQIAELADYDQLSSEVRFGEENSRIDFLLVQGEAQCYVEVKSMTLGENGIGYFPDAVTSRGQKHLRELMKIAQSGQRAVLLFCVQHTGVTEARPADTIDPEYAVLLRQAIATGVEVIAWQWQLSATSAVIKQPLPVVIDQGK